MARRASVKKKGSVYISPLLVIMCAAFLFFNYAVTMFSYLTAVLYHEFAHSIVAEKRGYRLNKFRLMPYGASVSGEFICVRPKDELIIAAAGPVSNFIVALFGVAMWWLFPAIYPFTEPLIMSSVFVGLVNLLPVFPLDGGRILLAAMSIKTDIKKAKKISKILSIILGAIATMSGIILMFFGGNFSYITLSVFVFVSAVLPDNESRYERLYSMAYSADRLKRGLPVREIMVSEDKTLLELSKMLSGNHYTRFLVTGGDFKVTKSFTETELEAKMMTHNAAAKVKSVDF